MSIQLTPTNNVVHFDFKQNQLRVLVDDNGEPWFYGSDVCRLLGIKQPYFFYQRLSDAEKRKVGRTNIGLANGPDVVFISKPGLNILMMRSDKEAAKEFQNWLAYEVLPSIQKTGSYTSPNIKHPSALNQKDSRKTLIQKLHVRQSEFKDIFNFRKEESYERRKN